MGVPGKDINDSLGLRTKIPNKKQKARTSITDVTNQYTRKLLKQFKVHGITVTIKTGL